jgi:uncharacterized membrane protein
MGTLFVMAEASAIIAIVYLVNQYIAKRQRSWTTYLIAFLVLCGILFTFSADAYNYQGYYHDYEALSDAEKKMCTDNMLKCERMAKYHYNLAKISVGGYRI